MNIVPLEEVVTLCFVICSFYERLCWWKCFIKVGHKDTQLLTYNLGLFSIQAKYLNQKLLAEELVITVIIIINMSVCIMIDIIANATQWS